jgi:hypothetical protein
VQSSGSITYLLSPSEIAPTGHSAAQAPQEIHSSLIAYAIREHLHIILPLYFNTVPQNCNIFAQDILSMEQFVEYGKLVIVRRVSVFFQAL